MEPKAPPGATHQNRRFEAASEDLRHHQQLLPREPDHVTQLQRFATYLIGTRDMDGLYTQIVDTVLGILHADLASIQRFHPTRGSQGELRLLGQRGFNAESAKHWEWVGP